MHEALGFMTASQISDSPELRCKELAFCHFL
jgi:hypothetical protein